MLGPNRIRKEETDTNRDALVAVGLPIVRRLAHRLARRLPPNVDVGDLIGAGTEGLLKAIAAYDPVHYPRFEPYAEARIRGAMLDQLRTFDTMTRHGRRRLAEWTRCIRKLEGKLCRAPTSEEIATELGLPLDEYHRLNAELARAPALARLGGMDPDHVVSSESDGSEQMDAGQLKARLVAAIDTLTERQRMVLSLYYNKECTQNEIGQILGVTESRVCQILNEAIVRLRMRLEEDAETSKVQ